MGIGMRGVLVLTLGLAMAATSSAAVYKVGDNSGWTILGNVNYSDWAVKKTFRPGDVIEFKYPQGIHNVLEVNKADYDSCTNSSPIATHTSGDDKISIRSAGHRFFICGVPGHCAAGQQVNIRVLKQRAPASSAAPSAAPAASPPAVASSGGGGGATTPAAGASTDGSSAGTTSPGPNANGARAAYSGYPAAAVVALAAVASIAMLQ